ncbi:MAG: bifunctional tetrahydrofolate synthase/dihydrofolate synthase [Gammaproteobacteria bacterium]|nr:bifunctional tetrahydrofolate synthase/dihydrofolate synthase [Gammaproteobacteria bacterium]
MLDKFDKVKDLDFWLQFISSVHPQEVQLGLDRIETVAVKMVLKKPASKVVVFAGTNGKGSCIASLESILVSAGYKVASYTSPHIHRFAERIKLNGKEVNERVLCAAFTYVESCREGVSLTYFEFSTLAALWIFYNETLDIALLEVGLGGRLDAVNLVDGDITVIPSIGFDHQDWLGHSLEEIGLEKAGILRANIPLVYGDKIPVKSILQRARELDAPIYLAGQQFDYVIHRKRNSWSWNGLLNGQAAVFNELPLPKLLISNVAISLQILALLDLKIKEYYVKSAIANLSYAGRQEFRDDISTDVRLLIDVAHNPAAAAVLAGKLRDLKEREPHLTQISAVIAVMADKDIVGMAAALETLVDIWYISQVDEARCMPAKEVVSRLEKSGISGVLLSQDSIVQAYIRACSESVEFEEKNPGKVSMVVVLGSFHSVAAVRELSKSTG